VNIWESKLVDALEFGTVDRKQLEYFDEIMSWITRGDDDSFLLLQKKIGERELAQRIEEFLDQLVVGDCPLGIMFPLKLNQENAKKRYRQLIRVFHPDRGVKSQEWLNNRAERINKAFEKYNDGEDAGVDFLVEEKDEILDSKPVNKFQTKGVFLKTRFTYQPSVWRERLGNPQQFQRKIISFLIVFSFLLVLLVFYSNQQQETYLIKKKAQIVTSEKDDQLPLELSSYVDDVKVGKMLKEADTLFKSEELVFDEYQGDDSNYIDEVDSSGVTESYEFNQKVEVDNQKQVNSLSKTVESNRENIEKIRVKERHLPQIVAKKANVSSIGRPKIVTQNDSIGTSKAAESNQRNTLNVTANKTESKSGYSHYINQLKRYYELGDNNGTADLYISSGRENDIRGSDKLRKYYKRAYSRTSNRRFDYVISSVKEDNESAVVIEGRASFSYTSKTLLKKTDNKIEATFTVLLLKVGKEYKIASFDWKKV